MTAAATGKKRVLFVDDEPAILAALENLLYRDRARWDMVFAVGAARALGEMRSRPFDVVVSDMRMPGMDGAALLDIVRAEFPATVRIILSGHAERESILRALPIMHQYLRKPCDPGTLRAAIVRCLDIVRQPSGDVRALIGRLDKLPAPRTVYFELERHAKNPASTIDDVARCVERDPAIAAKLLQLANSAAFGATRAIATIHDAVAYLGTELLQHLIMMSSLFDHAPQPPRIAALLERLHACTLHTAAVVRKLLPDHRDAELAFAAALLHDIGEGVLAVGMPDAYLALQAAARATHEPLVVAERRELGASHAEVGAYLLGMWGLPAHLVDLVAFHHEPRGAPAQLHRVLAALHVADALTCGHEDPSETMIDHGFLDELGVADQLPRWRSLAEQP
jgi:HD-like signal output (HDOD) protein